jgi:BON domain-containing protein
MTTGKRTHIALMLAAIALLVALGVGCNRARSDMQVATDVQSKINADGNLPNKQITVNANNGVVTLSGTVASDMERMAAANDAAQVDGVKTVVNNMTVGSTTAQNMNEQQPEQATPPSYSSARPRANRARRSTPSYSSGNTTESTSTPNYASNTNANTVAPTQAPSAPPKPVTIPDGTTISIRMIDSVDSDRNKPGDVFRATLDAPIMVDDQVIVPQGADVQGRVATLKAAGHYIGQSQIALELTKLSFNGKTYPVTTDQYTQQGASRGKNTAAKVGTGAAIGAVIGAIAGGGKGAGIGSVIGAGAGGGVQTVTKGEQIHIRPEAVLTFRMQSPITVTPGARTTSQYNSDTYNDNSNNTNDQNSSDTNNTSSTDRPTLKHRPPLQ